MTGPYRALVVFLAGGAVAGAETSLPYRVVDTGQVRCYDDRGEIPYPSPGEPYYGQDAQYAGYAPAWRDNGDGTVSDLVTGLMWTKDPGAKKTLAEAVRGAAACRTGGHTDWRLPTIKELYSLILFNGTDPDPHQGRTADLTPFIDRRYFVFHYGRAEDGERVIDSQYASATQYVSTTMGGNRTVFGVNFADGRIKGYPAGRTRSGRLKTYYVLYVRGNRRYGVNDFHDNGDGTVTDRATGLTWMKCDSGALKAGRWKDGRLDWREALAWAEGLVYAGRDDWRLPNAKELHTLVDYTRSPDTTGSAAIDPVFQATAITNEAGEKDFPCYWTNTTHVRVGSGRSAVYIAFGRALGRMPDRRSGGWRVMDVHGAGAQRSDAKTGPPERLPVYRGPQGDVMRVFNFVRCVRGGAAERRTSGPPVQPQAKPVPQPGGTSPRPGSRFIARLDRDGDGKVSRREFDGPPDAFARLDRDGDGYLTAAEAPQGPPPRRGPGGRAPRRRR